ARALGETGIYVWDMALAEEYGVKDDAWLELLDCPPTEMRGLRAWEAVIHPHDWGAVLECLNACIEGKTRQFEIEHRVLAKDGACRWMVTRGSRVGTNAQENGVRIIGTHMDITEQRNADGLRRVLARVFEASRMAIVILDARKRVLAANRA